MRTAAISLGDFSRAFAFIEDQHGVLALRLVEHFLDVLRRLAHVLIDQLGAVDDHQRPAHVEADRLGRHRLARAGYTCQIRNVCPAVTPNYGRLRHFTVEERRDALCTPVLPLEAPLAEQHRLRRMNKCG